ncbi:hypothetical protein [Oxalicibacterium solurbis]|uniref:Uncharacterized protein n=1 Tax=Oxalicibacterium solurbis TaxID=69280 RepID=A0A8J3AUN8_9BURK|nr:hypothetical protein [Oxalicibacterium solurbis]GGI53964.1 hypothetical protein GCM10011430_11380 [Oxalicibacterium solurbis]
MKTNIWQLLPTILVAALAAFVTSYFANRLINAQSDTNSSVLLWLFVCGILAAMVVAFTIGQRQVAALWRKAAAREERERERRQASWRQIVEAVHKALSDLADRYEDTPEDRMRIRIAYHRDTFTALAGTLAEIPVHELGSVEAAIALSGLKRNLRDAQYLADLYTAALSGNAATSAPRPFARIDLRSCKAFAHIHYMNFIRAMPI